jgi:MFS family permease
MAMLLAGRSLQGLGVGGLVALSYTIWGEMKDPQGRPFLSGIYCCTAAGTIAGPLIGAIVSDHGVWVGSPSCLRATC